MRKAVLILTLCALLIAGCGSPTPASPSDPTQVSTLPPLASPTLDVVTPEFLGRGFLEAWQEGNYTEMYSQLAPAQREQLTSEAFAGAYRTPLHTTTTISVTTLPETLNIDNDRAWIDFREVWHTAVFGDLQANNRLDMVRIGAQWWIEWDASTVWPDLVDGSRFGIEYQIPPRANIYDTTGAGLAIPATIVTVGVIPGRIEDEALLLDTLYKVLGLTYDEIQQRYAGQPADWYIPISDITSEESLAYDEMLTLPGVERRERTGRLYTLDGVASHVVGWLSPVPAEEYTEYRNLGYRGDEYVGISGLEAWGEEFLAGKNGARLYLVGSDGTYLGGMAEREAERGRAIYTMLDRDLQYQAEQALGARRGAVVAVDVATGAIRAMASGPGFDNNVFVRPTENWRLQATLSDPNQPLLNRATLGQYPAGSVFKIVTMAAGLGPGAMQAETPFSCPGYWDGLGVANRKFCWLETGHGDIVLQDGLTASCNVVFYEVGNRLDAIDTQALPTYGKAFGLGAVTGLTELPEASGLVPDPDWKWATYRENWGTGDTVHLAIGQGFLLVTPLQIARMVAAVANGGTLYQPYLVDRIAGPDGTSQVIAGPTVVGSLPVSAVHLAIIQEAMLGVTTNTQIGTAAHRFAGLDIPVAGKTGTAEPAQKDAVPHSWFAGYFPADNPEIAMVVLVENAGEGSTVAAPMFRQILEGYNGLPITPLPEPPAPAE
jgi:penicillin-binding protein 2